MAFVLSDRIKETTTTTGTGTYTLGGATTGFETFTANLSNGDTTYYCCTDGTDFEVGLGTFTSSGTTLARTTILSSSNSNNAVSWSSGTRNIFCTLPAEKSVVKDASGHVNLADNEEIKLGADGDLKIRHAGSNSLIEDNGGGSLIVKANPVFLLEKSGTSDRMILANAAGAVELYHNSVKKLETRSGGVTITGNLQFAETHSSDSNTQIFTETEQTNNQQTNLIIQAGDDATSTNEDSVRIRHKNYGNVTPQDFDMAIFKRNSSDNTKADINFNGDLSLTSTADGGPILSLISNDHSDAGNFDQEGAIHFFADNDANQSTLGFKIYHATGAITDGTEDGRLRINIQKGGSGLVDSFQLSHTILFLENDNHIIRWNNTKGTNYDIDLVTTTPTAARTITLPNATGNVQLNQGSGETNGTFQNFQQDYQSSSYFVAGEYIEIATINPNTNSSNFNFIGTMMAQISQNIQVLDIRVGIRYSSSGNISREIGYTSHQIGDDYIEPVLWINTSTNTIKLLMKAKTGSIHKTGVNLCFFQRGNYDDTTWNTTVVQDTTSVPSGYTEYTGEKVASFITNGAVELYHNNVKKLETTSTGVTVTGLLSATTKSFDIKHPTKPKMRLRYGSLEGPENGVYVRGRLKNRHVINLPDYWTGLVHEDSITVNLTPIGNHQGLYIESIENNMVFVSGESNDKIDCFYTVYGERKDVEKLEVEYES